MRSSASPSAGGKNTSLGSINLAVITPAGPHTAIRPDHVARPAPLPPGLDPGEEITGARVQMRPSVTAVSGLGDQALLIRIVQVNGPLPDGTYYPGDYLLVARVGGYLADVHAPAFPVDVLGTAVRSLMSALASRLQPGPAGAGPPAG